MARLISLILTLLFVFSPNLARARDRSLSAETIAKAEVGDKGRNKNRAALIKAAILLDRAHFSPGVIDGIDGENVQNAIRAFQAANNLSESGSLNAETLNKLLAGDADPLLTEYIIAKDDVKGPFTARIPAKNGESGCVVSTQLSEFD